MSTELSIVSNYISINLDEPISKVFEYFKENVREVLVFDEKGIFFGYLTKKNITRQSRIQPDTNVSSLLQKVPTVKKNSSVDDIARALLSAKINTVPIEDEGKIIGVYRDIDVIRVSAALFKDKTVKDMMTPNPICVSPDTTTARLIAISRTNNISRAPVIDENNYLLGIVSPHDMAELLIPSFPTKQTRGDRSAVQYTPLAAPIKDIMTEEVVSCKENELVLEAISKLYKTNHKTLIIINEENHPVGVLTTTDLLETVSIPPKTEGYYVRVIGDVDDEDMEPVIEMGVDLVKKFAPVIGSFGQLFIHAKSIPKKKFRGFVLYQIRLRISTDKGHTYVAKAEGYGVFSAYVVALDRLEREIISERELAIQSRQSGSERYLLDELEEV